MLINIVIRSKISYLSLTESNFALNVRNQYYVPHFYFTDTAQKTKFSAKIADLVTYTEEILNGKLLCSVNETDFSGKASSTASSLYLFQNKTILK